MFGIILKGVCEVKLGYKVALSLTDYADLKLQGDWKRLWNLTLPPKGKHLLSRPETHLRGMTVNSHPQAFSLKV